MNSGCGNSGRSDPPRRHGLFAALTVQPAEGTGYVDATTKAILAKLHGRWHTLHVYCNSPNEKIDQQAMVSAVQELFEAVGRTLSQ